MPGHDCIPLHGSLPPGTPRQKPSGRDTGGPYRVLPVAFIRGCNGQTSGDRQVRPRPPSTRGSLLAMPDLWIQFTSCASDLMTIVLHE